MGGAFGPAHAPVRPHVGPWRRRPVPAHDHPRQDAPRPHHHRAFIGNLPTDFGFVIDVHSHEPETVYVVPITSDSAHFVPEGKLRVYRSRAGGNEWEALTKGLPQKDCYVNVLRDAMAVDSLDA